MNKVQRWVALPQCINLIYQIEFLQVPLAELKKAMYIYFHFCASLRFIIPANSLAW